MSTYPEEFKALEEENERLQKWVNDLQAGMYINCVYCGHRYGPEDEVPATMADVLKEHIEKCPKHPLSIVRKAVKTLEEKNERLKAENKELKESISQCHQAYHKTSVYHRNRIKELVESINYAVGGIDALSPNWPEQVKKDVSAIKKTLDQALE